MTAILLLSPYRLTDYSGSDEDWVQAVSYSDQVTGAPVDLTGISFTLTAGALTLSTAANTLQIVAGAGTTVPNTLLINAPAASIVSALDPNATYAVHCQAAADGHTRDVLLGTLTLRPD